MTTLAEAQQAILGKIVTKVAVEGLTPEDLAYLGSTLQVISDKVSVTEFQAIREAGAKEIADGVSRGTAAITDLIAEVQQDTSAIEMIRTEVEGIATDVREDRTAAQTSATAAAEARAAAERAKNTLETNVNAANESRDLAAKWAEAPDNTDIAGAGTRSARHHARLAAKDRQQTQADQTQTGQDRQAVAADRIAVEEGAAAAAASAVKAKASEVALGDSVDIAERAAAAAGESEGAAAISEIEAEASALAANGSADRAEDSETNAKASENAAAASAESAASSEAKALASKEAAAESEANAATSARSIQDAETNAAGSAASAKTDAERAEAARTQAEAVTNLGNYYTKAQADDLVAGKLDASTYTAEDVLAKLKTVDGEGSGIDADLLDGLNSAYLMAWANMTGVPTAFPPTAHDHDGRYYTKAEIDARPVPDTSWNGIVGKPETFAPSAHTHAQSEITGLADALAGKANLASPIFVGMPQSISYAPVTRNQVIATTQFVHRVLETGAERPTAIKWTTVTPDETVPTQIANVEYVTNKLATKADLDPSTGKLREDQVPAIAITETSVVASQAAMLALVAQTGDIAVRSDLNKTFALAASPASTLANWIELRTPTDAVLSVAGKTGAVALVAGDIGGLASALDAKLAVSAKATGAELRALTNDTNYLTSKTHADAVRYRILTSPVSGGWGLPLSVDLNFDITLAGNVIFTNSGNSKEGASGVIVLRQDATGGRTVAWSSFFDFGADGPPTIRPAPNAVDYVFYVTKPGATGAICSYKAGA